MTHKLSHSRLGDYHLLIGPYDPDLIAWLKSEVPLTHREWAGVAKAWRIFPPYVEAVRKHIEERDA